MKNIILITPPYFHFNGNLLETESDIFSHFKKSLSKIDQNLIVSKFNIKQQNYLELDLEFLKNKVNSESLIFIDGNIDFDNSYKIYPTALIDFLKKSKAKKICFIPDLIKDLNFKQWVDISDIIIGFTKDAVLWANKFYKTKKFYFYPSIPIDIYKIDNYSDFLKRPYDIGYVGSDKNFRSKFLKNLILQNSDRLKILMINSNRQINDIKTTNSYLDILSKCKFNFCTRASAYEKYNVDFFDFKISDGRFAGRVSESISCGSIPLYWQPKKGSYYFANFRKKILFSKKNKVFNNIALEGDIHSTPYDNMDKNLKNGITFVKNVEDAINKIINCDKDYIMKKLEFGLKIHRKYISPFSFFSFVKERLND